MFLLVNGELSILIDRAHWPLQCSIVFLRLAQIVAFDFHLEHYRMEYFRGGAETDETRIYMKLRIFMRNSICDCQVSFFFSTSFCDGLELYKQFQFAYYSRYHQPPGLSVSLNSIFFPRTWKTFHFLKIAFLFLWIPFWLSVDRMNEQCSSVCVFEWLWKIHNWFDYYYLLLVPTYTAYSANKRRFFFPRLYPESIKSGG